VLDAPAGAEMIVTLGDMGERSGLDALAKIAPVIGVRGMDDEEDSRTVAGARVLAVEGVRIACVFDPVAAGAVSSKEGLRELSKAAAARVFGEAVNVVLWAPTHVPSVERTAELLLVNPGSATLPDKDARPAFARLSFVNGIADAELVELQSLA
jgi:predicted phosphodiesterase